MNIEEKNFTTYSRIGSRATYGLVILDLVKNNKNIIVIPADTSTSAGLDRLKKQFPENYIDVGISEQNSISEQNCSELFRIGDALPSIELVRTLRLYG